MTRQLHRQYPGPGGMLAFSFGIHLALLLLLLSGHFLPALHPDENPVTYVDVVTLPVASPQSGTPAQAAESAPRPPAPAAAAAPKAEMSQPASKPKANSKRPVPAAKAKPANSDREAREAREFDQRMAKLERQADERRQNEVLARLKKGVAGRTGMPGAKGSQAGSDYASYVQSRLRDAFRQVVVSQSRSPQVIVTLTIGSDGRVTDNHVEKSSGDPLFDDAVARAITLAGRSLRPPPDGGQFKKAFRFKPEGVGVR